MGRKLMIALFCGCLLFLWWQYPMSSLRGAHLDIRHRAADEYIERHGGNQQGSGTGVESGGGSGVISLDWVGDPDPLHFDRVEADAQSLCLRVRQEMLEALGDGPESIVMYRCSVSESKASAGDSRKVPLSLGVGMAEKGDGERLVRAVAEHPSVLLNSITVSENENALEQGGMPVHKEFVTLNLDYYLLAEPLPEQLQEAESKKEDEALERMTGAMEARLIARAEAALETAERKRACHTSGRNWFDGGTTVAASTASNWSNREQDPLERKPSHTAGAEDGTPGCVDKGGR